MNIGKIRIDRKWLLQKFPSQTEMIGFFYNRYAQDEATAKRMDTHLAKDEEWYWFKDNIQKGDELWFFRSELPSWRRGQGIEGFCIVDRGDIIAHFITTKE